MKAEIKIDDAELRAALKAYLVSCGMPADVVVENVKYSYGSPEIVVVFGPDRKKSEE